MWVFFHAGIIVQLVEYTVMSMKKGYIPVFFINNQINTKKSLCLEWFFEQPHKTIFELENLEYNNISYVDEKIENIPYRIEGEYLWNLKSKDWQIWHKLALRIVAQNEFLHSYIINDKKKNQIHSENMLGVLIRGTDYVKLKPKLHPVQPDIDEVIEKVHEIMDTKGFTELYVATDEKRIYERMVEEFGAQNVFSNTREYYDEIYRDGNMNQICEARLERKNDQFLNSIEYISSMMILAECKGITGGNCTGALVAALLGEHSYDFFFNKGVY